MRKTSIHFLYPESVFVNLLGAQESIPSLAGRYDNPFLVPARRATESGGTDSSESIPGLHKRLQIRVQGAIHKV